MQLRAHDRSDFASVREHIIEDVRRAASQADLLVLPEATFPAYVLGAPHFDETEIAGALDRLRDIAIASRTVIVVGAAARDDAGIRNGAFVIDADGSLAGRADKLFLWHFDRRWFVPGSRVEPIHTAAGTLGVLICADGRLPTIARTLVDRGAHLLVMPTAWVTSGRNPGALENVQADLLARVRAFENGVPFVAANKCGSELGMVAYCGKSQVIDASGEIVAIAGEGEPETLLASIACGAARPHRFALEAVPRPAPQFDRTARLAISCEPLPGDIGERLELLDDDFALSPHDESRNAAAARALPMASAGDDRVLDPAGLVGLRRSGYSLICWRTTLEGAWTERVARARAIELRLYLVVFDLPKKRAFAVDPDGTVVAGTFGTYRLASFLFDPRKAAETIVAPGSDVAEALERVAAIVDARD
jgi:predicted amidohydrolase